MANDVTLDLGNDYIGSAYSPVVEVTDTEDGHTISITSADPDAAGHLVTHTIEVPTYSEEEEGREAAEAARHAAEAARQAQEAQRQAAESARASTESERAAEEQERADAETARAAAETARQTAETARQQAEQARAAAETARESASATAVANAEAATAAANAAAGRVDTAIADAEDATDVAEDAAASATSAAGSATTAAGDANTAATAATSAASAANTAAATANTAAETAETAADAADAAREGIQTDLAAKADKTGTYSTLIAGGTTPDSVTDAMLKQTGGVLTRVVDIEEALTTGVGLPDRLAPSYSQGYVHGNNYNTPTSSNNTVYSQLFTIDHETLHIDVESGYKAVAVFFDDDDDWIANDAWKTGSATVNLVARSTYKQYAIEIRATSEAPITPSGIEGVVTAYYVDGITDATLSASGMAADAKATGEYIGLVHIDHTTDAGKYIAANGIVAENANFNTYVADVDAGVEVHLANVSSTNSLCTVAKKDGDTYTPLVLGIGLDKSPHDATYLVEESGTYVFSWRVNTTPELYGVRRPLDSVFVATDGSDTNAGTIGSPLATVYEATRRGARVVNVRAGDYFEVIYFPTNITKDLELRSYDKTGRVRFYSPYCVLSSSESKVSGYEKVYSCAITKDISQQDFAWIYQDDVDDVSTLISDAERHPLQRGKFYRCEDTRIVRCAATTQADALAEIDASDEYKWFVSGSTLYFSRPQEVTAEHKLCVGTGSQALNPKNRDRAASIKFSGIEFKYMPVTLFDLTDALLVDCRVANVQSVGGFIYGGALGVTFVRCEASRVYTTGGGDGFNAHSDPTGETFSKQTTCTMVDCWSHDNNDDGYSDHERSETTIIGGLFEYNGKAGVTPAYGSHCTCYNVHSRKNYSGFVYTGAATQEEGGNGGQMELFGCLSEDNTRGTGNYGYCVRGGDNTARLVNCKSIGNGVGYYADTDTDMQVIDCGSYGDTTVKDGGGTIAATVTTAVS